MSALVVRTARYSNPNVSACGLVPIGITRGTPKFKLGYELRANLYDLAPAGAMLGLPDDADKRERFTAMYRARLDALGVGRVRELLEAIQNGDDGIVLLCYEDLHEPGKWCHREILGAWLTAHGIDTQELDDPGKKAKPKAGQERLFT
jgi:hypothetical protein